MSDSLIYDLFVMVRFPGGVRAAQCVVRVNTGQGLALAKRNLIAGLANPGLCAEKADGVCFGLWPNWWRARVLLLRHHRYAFSNWHVQSRLEQKRAGRLEGVYRKGGGFACANSTLIPLTHAHDVRRGQRCSWRTAKPVLPSIFLGWPTGGRPFPGVPTTSSASLASDDNLYI